MDKIAGQYVIIVLQHPNRITNYSYIYVPLQLYYWKMYTICDGVVRTTYIMKYTNLNDVWRSSYYVNLSTTLTHEM